MDWATIFVEFLKKKKKNYRSDFGKKEGKKQKKFRENIVQFVQVSIYIKQSKRVTIKIIELDRQEM